MTACNCAAHAMPPATGAFTEGVGPGDGCSRPGRAFLGMSCVLERVVSHPKGFTGKSANFPPQPLGRRFVVGANFVGKKRQKRLTKKLYYKKITQLISRHLVRKTGYEAGISIPRLLGKARGFLRHNKTGCNLPVCTTSNAGRRTDF